MQLVSYRRRGCAGGGPGWSAYLAILDHLDPLHVIGGIPTLALDYSPLWDINLGRWTPEAVRRGYRSRLIDEFQLLEFVRRGFITNPAGAPYGSVGIRVNCPIVHRFM